jgi:hypothetical protein
MSSGATLAKNDKPKQRTYVSVKIDAEIYRLIRTVAAYRGVNVGDYLSDIAEPPARRDFDKMKKESGQDE